MYKKLNISVSQFENNVVELECGRHEFNRENLYYVTVKNSIATCIINGVKSKSVKFSISARMFNILVDKNPTVKLTRNQTY